MATLWPEGKWTSWLSERSFLSESWNFGQHSLTSVEGPSYLRSDFVNPWRHARLEVFICVSSAPRSSRDFVPLFRSFLDWFQSIQTRRCHCHRLKDVLIFQASSLYSAGKRTFPRMLVNNILWMTLDHQAVYLGEIIHYHFPYWIHIQYKIAILIFHTWGEGSILLFIIPLLCHFTI